MKMKLAAFLAVIALGLAGCGGAANNSNATNSSNSANTGNRASTTTPAKTDEGMVKASADPTSETGGTKEGCKCSAVGMKCSTKAGEKGCCGKEGECSAMVDGKSSCCADKGGDGDACCSTAGKMAMDDKNACNPGEKPAATTTGKKS